MFERLKILKEAGAKLYPYFTPSYNNCARFIGFITSVIVVPVANYCMPMIFLKKDNVTHSENEHNNMNIIMTLASVSSVALLFGLQKGLSNLLTTSTMQAMRKDNVQLLMDDSRFLLHGNNKDIKSLQYVTVGVGVRDFAANTVPVFTSLPMDIISSVSTLVHIGIITGSFSAPGIVLGFAAASAISMGLFSKGYSIYQANNQRVENDLVAKIAFIEAHGSAISLMGVSDKECVSVMQSIQKVDSSIPKITALAFFYYFLTSASPAIASQFLGGYYTDRSIRDLSSDNIDFLNVMIMSLLLNVQDIVWILTNNYSYIKLNLEQLRAFDTAHNDCLSIRNTYNKMVQEFDGNHLSLLDFTIYRPDIDRPQNIITVFNKITLELHPNQVYKLLGDSGSGKTTFLKSITNNWQYTEGIVKLPENAKDSICFIPQHSFIPKGTLLEILTYCLDSRKFFINSSQNVHKYYEQSIIISINDSYEEKSIEQPLLSEQSIFKPYSELHSSVRESEVQDSMPKLIKKATDLLRAVRLLPDVIKIGELEAQDINWSERLSGGEKQKIGIIQALLTKPKFIIMDESTSALDRENKQIIYELIKSYLRTLENYTVIYTDHDNRESFADAHLTIVGQSLEYDY